MIYVIAVGKLKSEEQSLYLRYAQRLYSTLKTIEIKESNKNKEAEMILKSIPLGSYVIGLDLCGQALSSESLAQFIRKLQENHRSLCFILGGPEGLADQVLQSCSFLLNLSAMTMTHMMARAFLIEQLYRTQCILTDHPYHK